MDKPEKTGIFKAAKTVILIISFIHFRVETYKENCLYCYDC